MSEPKDGNLDLDPAPVSPALLRPSSLRLPCTFGGNKSRGWLFWKPLYRRVVSHILLSKLLICDHSWPGWIQND